MPKDWVKACEALYTLQGANRPLAHVCKEEEILLKQMLDEGLDSRAHWKLRKLKARTAAPTGDLGASIAPGNKC